MSDSVYVTPGPIANFTSDTVCEGDSTTFTDLSQFTPPLGVEIQTWLWDFGDGNTSTDQNPTHLYSNAGVYNAVLIVTDTNGCQGYDTNVVIVDTLPIANFSFTDTICLGDTTFFSDLSVNTSGNINNWQWNFGDGNTSTDINPYHIYSNPGTYTVTLTVTDDNLCTHTDTQTVIIRPNPIADYIISDSCWPNEPLCVDSIFNLSGNSSVQQPLGGNLDFSYWILDGSSPVLTAYSTTYFTSFSSPGVHTIQYIVETEYGCLDTTEIDSFLVVEIPICDFEVNDTLCVNDTAIYVIDNLSSGYITEYVWNIYDSTGTQLVWTSDTLQWINGGINIPVFPNVLQAFNDTTYIISLTVINCCGSNTCIQPITIQPLPIINPLIYNIPVYIAANNTTTINLNSYISTINTDYIIINWGDPLNLPNIDTITPNGSQPYWPSVTHLYPDTGAFVITITAINNCGSSDTTLSVDVVPNLLYSEFIPASEGCQDDEFIFVETSYPHPNTEVYWCFDWDPSNGNCNLNNNPLWIPYVLNDSISYTYTEPGEYLVYHEIRDIILGSGFSDTSVYPVIVHPKPTAVIDSCNNICQNTSTSLTHSSWIDSLSTPNYNQQIVGVKWEIFETQNPNNTLFTSFSNTLNYTFNQFGNYTIILEVTSNNGCKNYDTCNIVVYELPSAQFTIIPDSSCLGNGLTCFDANSSVDGSGGQIIDYIWNFPNANPANGIGVLECAEFLNNGNWFIDLIVIDQVGCKDTITDTLIVNDSMTAYFESTTECLGTPTTFNSAYPLSSPNANSWSWDFGDGNTSNLQNPTNLYNAPGDYLVTLTLWDNGYADSTDCIDSWTDTVHIYELPSASFVFDTVCFGESTNFIDISTASEPNSNLLFIRDWYFNNDNLIDATDSIASFQFDTCGLNVFDVTLGVYDDNGCYDETTESITISCPPSALFSFDTICKGEPTVFTSISDSGSFPIIGYNWYNSGGSYLPLNDSIDYYATYTFNNSGPQDFTSLVVYDQFGCKDSVHDYAYVQANPVADFITLDTNFCINEDIQFLDNSFTSNTIDYTYWTFSTGTPADSYLLNPTVSFPSYGDWLVTLYVEDIYECSDQIDSLITIDNLPSVDFSWIEGCADTAICFNNLSNQSINGNALMLWEWNFNDGSYSSDLNPCHEFVNVDEYLGECQDVTLTVTDSLGCSNFKTYEIILHPIPKINLDVPIGICEGTLLNVEDLSTFSYSANCVSDALDQTIWYVNDFSPGSGVSFAQIDSLTLNNAGSSSDIKLEVITSWGNTIGSCKNDTIITVQYWRNPSLDYSIDYPNDQCGEEIPFNFSGNTEFSDSLSITFNDPVYSINNDTFIYIAPFPLNNPDFNFITPNSGIFDLNIFLKNEQCKLNINDSIAAYPVPVADFTPDDYTFCEKDTLIFFNSEPSYIINQTLFEQYGDSTFIDSWLWTINNENPTTPVAASNFDASSNDTTYIIELQVQTNFGCFDQTSGKITVYPTPIPNFVTKEVGAPNYGTYILDGRSSTTSNGIDSATTNEFDFNWTIFDTETIIIENQIGNDNIFRDSVPDFLYYQFNNFQSDTATICLELESKEYGCRADTCKIIDINAYYSLYVPNALYPDAGDESSIFLPKGKSLIEYRLQIFDKFGNLLWETGSWNCETDLGSGNCGYKDIKCNEGDCGINFEDGSPKYGWDGKNRYTGANMPQGTYIWRIDAKFSNGPWQGVDGNKKTGVLYLVR